jgi:beta-lactamase class A
MPLSRSHTVLRAAPFLLLPALLSACSGATGAPARTASPTASASASPAVSQTRTAQALAQLERRFSARLGVYVLDTGTSRTVTYGAGERFAGSANAPSGDALIADATMTALGALRQ